MADNSRGDRKRQLRGAKADAKLLADQERERERFRAKKLEKISAGTYLQTRLYHCTRSASVLIILKRIGYTYRL